MMHGIHAQMRCADFNYLVFAGMPVGNQYRSFGYIQHFGEIADQCKVSAPFDRLCLQPDFLLAVKEANYFTFLCVRCDLH